VYAAAIKLLPQDTPVVDATPTQVAGWGRVRLSGPQSEFLLCANVPIVDRAECELIYGKSILPSEICAGVFVELCEGDDGAALVYNGTLVGIATRGNTCGNWVEPGIYTNAAMFTDWIMQNSGLRATED
jgi:secreted trypsin-like serine protease